MSALAHRDFQTYQAARLAMVVGVQLQATAVGWQVYRLTGRPLDLGLVGLAQFAPMVLLSLLAGQVADRVDRRTILLFSTLADATCALLLVAVARSSGGVFPIYAILVLFGITRAFQGPAGQALVPTLVPAEDLTSAIAINSSTWQLATIAAPPLAGILYDLTSATVVYVTAAVLFFVAAAVLTRLRPRRDGLETRRASLATVIEGVAYVRNHPVILGSISLDLFAVLLGGAVALLPAYATDVLHAGSWAFGLLRAAPAIGAGAVALAVARFPLGRRAGARMLACVALFGLATIAFGLTTSLPVAVTALVVIGGADMVSVVVRQTLVQRLTPPEMRGRVSAVNLVFIGASNELGEFKSGVTAAAIGIVPAIVAGGVGTLVVVALWAWWFPDLRKLDRLE